MAFFNLDTNPRPWHDEGAALSLAKTLATDGVYGVKNSDGYQTYGPVQSVGPTVILPIALSFKFFGIGLVQGRIVPAIYLIVAILIFFACGKFLWGYRTAAIGLFLLIASPGNILYFGRQALGEVPALVFFLAAWLTWAFGVRGSKMKLHFISGLLLGAAIVTKSQYLVMGIGTIGLLVLLDIFYYKLGNIRSLLIVGSIAFGCYAAWMGWQYIYFGQATFIENANKMSLLAKISIGLHKGPIIQAFQYIFGPDSRSFLPFYRLCWNGVYFFTFTPSE